MGDVIKFPKEPRVDPNVRKLKEISDSLDAVIIHALEKEGIDPYELAGLVAHRLGTLIRPIEQKKKLWGVCEKVLKRQAVIE